MSIDCLISGTLHGKPQARTSKTGNKFATATIRAAMRGAGGQEGESNATFVSVIAFSQSAVEALLALDAGDAVCVSGEGTLKLWTPKEGGEPRPQLDLLAHAVMSPYVVSRKREATRAARKSGEPGPASELQEAREAALSPRQPPTLPAAHWPYAAATERNGSKAAGRKYVPASEQFDDDLSQVPF